MRRRGEKKKTDTRPAMNGGVGGKKEKEIRKVTGEAEKVREYSGKNPEDQKEWVRIEKNKDE